MNPSITAFFDETSDTVSYVVADPAIAAAAVIDSVLDFDPASSRIAMRPADRIIRFVREEGLRVEWILETHVHADHLTAALYLKEKLGGKVGIDDHIQQVQREFKIVFNPEAAFATDGRQFEHLFADEEAFRIGSLEVWALWTPGHTPADMTYLVGDAAFVGDTLFMPDYGTARTDFPGGDARALATRMRAAGPSDDASFVIRLTQALIANLLGLSLPHVNRTLRRLREQGFIDTAGAQIRIADTRHPLFALVPRLDGDDGAERVMHRRTYRRKSVAMPRSGIAHRTPSVSMRSGFTHRSAAAPIAFIAPTCATARARVRR